MQTGRKYVVPLAGLMLMSLSVAYLFSENKKKNIAKSPVAFGVSADIVVVNATVTDKEGNPVTDLTAKDFRVYDNGRLQEIQTFATESSGPAETKTIETQTAPQPGIHAIRKTEARPRMIAFFIDDLTMYSGVEHFPRLKEAIKAFVKNEMGPMDQVALISASRQAQVPFTGNKRQLLDGINVAFEILNYIPVGRAVGADYRAWRIARHDDWGSDRRDEKLLSLYYYINARMEHETRNLLFTLRRHIRALRHFEGEKMIMLFSDGFISEAETSESSQLQEIINLALHSGIVLNTANMRGVENMDPMIGPDSIDHFMKYVSPDISAQESPLIRMAHDTGGMFIHNSNDMHKQIQTIYRRKAFYYILSYGMPSQKAGGIFHSIRLETTRPGLQVSYRKNYFTAKEDLAFENRKKEDILEALTGPGNMNEIPMNLSYNYSQEEDSTYSVSFLTVVNARKLHFMQEGDQRTNQINFVLAVFDENDRYVNGLEKSIDFRLQESSYQDIRDRGLKSTVEFKLPIGRYKIKAVVREDNRGKMGSITKAVEIP